MEHKFEGIIMLFLTISIGVILVASVVLPQTFASSSRHLVSINNATDLSPVNSTGYQNATFTTTYVYPSLPCLLTVTFNHNYTPNYTVITDISNTVIANFTAGANNASNVTQIIIPAANINATTNSIGQVVQQWRYNTSSAVTEVNVTDAILSCTQRSTFEQRGADAGSLAMWAIVPLVIIASLILLVMGGRR